MKTKLIFIFALFLVLAGCSKDSTRSVDDTLTGRWKLVKYHNMINATVMSEPSNIAKSIIINFSDDGINGSIDGYTVANRVFGAYELFSQKKMKTLRFGGTEVGEPQWGDKFWDAIRAASSFDIQADRLFIFFNNDLEKMEFEKQ